MPESNDPSEIGQPIPASNRFVAALVDMMVVAMPTIVVALVLSERFPILDNSNGRPRFSEPDQLRINEIDQGFNRAMRLGETVFTLSGSGWWLTLLVLITLTAFVFVVLPSKLKLRTPGQLLLSVPLVADADEQLETVIIVDDPSEIEDPSGDRVQENGTESGADEASSFDNANTQESSEPTRESADSADSSNASETADTTDPSHSSESQPAEIASPVSLGDTGDYLAWDREQATTAASASASRSAGSSFDSLALTESSLAESDLNASTAVKTKSATPSAAATAATTTVAATTANGAGTAESPIWSDLWNAWLYWDPASDRWFRHDTDNNCWKPLK